MNKRIRYANIGDNVFESVRTIQVASGWVKVRYNLNNLVVNIINADNPEESLRTFVSANPMQMKKSIKTNLLEMGATFEKETRTHAE